MNTRREFLGAAALVGLSSKAERRIAGGFVFASEERGHRLRDRAVFRSPRREERVPVVIVGAGIGGLSAAWRLQKRGFGDFVVLEMEADAGGNARWGENEISRYPWAAHYIPVPSKKMALVRELLEELGVLLADGKWDERVLCFSPQERLFLHGRWQDGLEPEIAATEEDRRQYREFQKRIDEFRATGQFTIPIEAGARASPLDGLSMQEWLRRNRFTSPYLDWYVNYACRDDYGALARDTSAWAGIHYYASREPEEKGPLAWPEGNGWITRKLLEKVGRRVRTNAAVYRIEPEGARWRVLTEEVEYHAEAVIFAAPTFLARYLVANGERVESFVYSPWLVANLTLERLPDDNGAPLAWDNVIYDSPALGYVNATHMSLRSHLDRTVWTFYWALAEAPPAESRMLMLERNWAEWKDAILGDLERAHPDIRQCVSRLDIFRIGHAMVRPVPGFLTSPERLRYARASGGLLFANSDLSGISIFEEAQYRGVTAADRALARIGGRGSRPA